MRAAAVVLFALARLAAPRPADETCVFLLATPGSGSSTMAELLARAGVEMSGENWGAFAALARFAEKMRRTAKQPRSNAHDAAAWRAVFDAADVDAATDALARAVLNPRGAPAFGFKEIRYGRPPNVGTFRDDVAFLETLCARPRVVLHMRRNATREFHSAVVGDRPAVARDSRQQRECFASYAGAAPGPCGPPRAAAFVHYLEDYIDRTPRHAALWDYVGLAEPARDDVHLSSKQGGHSRRATSRTSATPAGTASKPRSASSRLDARGVDAERGRKVGRRAVRA